MTAPPRSGLVLHGRLLGDWTVAELREELRQRGLLVSGRKDELVMRLEEDESGVRSRIIDAKPPPRSSSLAIPEDRIAKVESSIEPIIEHAKSIKVRDDSDYALAADFLTASVKAAIRKVDEIFDPNIKRWHEGHRAALADKKKVLEPLLEAERIVKKEMAQFHTKKLEAQREAQRQLEASMRKAVEEDAYSEAARLFEEGREEEGQAIIDSLSDESPQLETALPLVPRGPRAQGVSVRRVKRFRVVAPSLVARKFLIPDMRAIQKVVDALPKDEALRMVGGIEIFEEEVVSARAR